MLIIFRLPPLEMISTRNVSVKEETKHIHDKFPLFVEIIMENCFRTPFSNLNKDNFKMSGVYRKDWIVMSSNSKPQIS